tara:strand:+ start:55 stop:606 length:552 start_codon:yes stop_codon:yes gene_type:complete
MITRYLKNIDKIAVINFCYECKKLNYTNNQSLESIKYDQLDGEHGVWVGTFNHLDRQFRKSELMGLSGVHKLFDGVRVHFRGATLPQYAPKGLGKNVVKQIFQYRYHLPFQIMWGYKNIKDCKFYITTNVEKTDHLNKMDKIILPLSEKQGIVNYVGQDEVFSTLQNIWQVNVENYFNALSNF